MTSCSHIQMLCWIQSHVVSHCAVTDVQCQCQSDVTITYVSHCVVNNCTLQDAIGSFSPTGSRLRLTILSDVSHFWAQACHRPHNNQYSQMRAAAIGSGVAAFLMVACRILARLYTGQRFWWDDWLHIVSGVRCLRVDQRVHRELTL